MTSFYLASRYSRHVEMQRYAKELVELGGHVVTSRWIEGDHQISDAGLLESSEGSVAERMRFATEDWHDLRAADAVISFTEVPRGNATGASRGGRHVEFGAALAWGKLCYVIGHRENVFHCLPQVTFYYSWSNFWFAQIMDPDSAVNHQIRETVQP